MSRFIFVIRELDDRDLNRAAVGAADLVLVTPFVGGGIFQCKYARRHLWSELAIRKQSLFETFCAPGLSIFYGYGKFWVSMLPLNNGIAVHPKLAGKGRE